MVRTCSRCSNPIDPGSHSYCRAHRRAESRRSNAKHANRLRVERAGMAKEALFEIGRGIHGRSKYCPSCDRHVPIDAGGWYARPERTDGLSGHCRSCTIARTSKKASE